MEALVCVGMGVGMEMFMLLRMGMLIVGLVQADPRRTRISQRGRTGWVLHPIDANLPVRTAPAILAHG
jgi:hypothetical protein